MKYIKNTIFEPVEGYGSMLVKDLEHGDEEEHNATVGEVLRMVLELYQPSQGKSLNTPAEINSFNKAMSVLRKGPQEGEHYRFEDSDFKVMLRVIEWTGPNIVVGGRVAGAAPRQFWRNTPVILGLLEKATEAVPV